MQTRQGESKTPDKLFRPAESFLVVLIIWILLEIVSNFVQQTPQEEKQPNNLAVFSFSTRTRWDSKDGAISP